MAKPPAPPPPRYIRLPEVVRRTGVSGRQIYRWIGSGAFPKQRRMSYRVSVWIEAEVDEWLRLCVEIHDTGRRIRKGEVVLPPCYY